MLCGYEHLRLKYTPAKLPAIINGSNVRKTFQQITALVQNGQPAGRETIKTKPKLSVFAKPN